MRRAVSHGHSRIIGTGRDQAGCLVTVPFNSSSKLVMRGRFSSPAPHLPALVSDPFTLGLGSGQSPVICGQATHGPHLPCLPADPEIKGSRNLAVPLTGISA